MSRHRGPVAAAIREVVPRCDGQTLPLLILADLAVRLADHFGADRRRFLADAGLPTDVAAAPPVARRRRGPSAGLLRAMDRINAGESAYAAARAEGIMPGTVYRSPLYKARQRERAATAG